MHAEEVGEAHGAADQPAQDVAAVLVARDDAVVHEEAHRAGVVGQDAQRVVVLVGLAVGAARDRLGGVDERPHDVGVDDGGGVLEEHQPALEAGAGVDVLGRQRAQRAIGVAEVAHEHEVPELDVAIAAAVGGAALLAPLGPAVVVDLRARAARARLPHLPEVVLVEALDPLHRDPDLLVPDRLGGIVGEVDGGPDAIAVEARRQHELPRPLDGLELVVLAEAPVAEHLEEGEVAAGAADLVDVVVLAGQAHALLDRRRPGRVVRHRLLAEEVRDELHHPRVGEHRGGGMGGDQARRRHERVLASLEELVPGAPQRDRVHERIQPTGAWFRA